MQERWITVQPMDRWSVAGASLVKALMSLQLPMFPDAHTAASSIVVGAWGLAAT